MGNIYAGRLRVFPDAQGFATVLIQSCSRRHLREAHEEIRELKAQLRELQSANMEWRKEYAAVEHIIANLREQLNSSNQEIQRQNLAPYGAYSVSGANPYVVKSAVQRVSHALSDFVLSIRIPAGKPSTDIADLSRDEALVSAIFFSMFERVDLGVDGVAATFVPPPQLPEVSFQEYKAFDAFMEDRDDCLNQAAVAPYWRRFHVFHELVCVHMDKLFQLGPIEANDERRDRFLNLAMCVWMMHKLTLSFDKTTVKVMRVGRGEEFNKEYMATVPGRQDEDQHMELGRRSGSAVLVEHLIIPGLWINGSVFKCCVFLASPAHQEKDCAPEIGNKLVKRKVEET